MQIKVLFAIPDIATTDLMYTLSDSAVCLVPFEVEVATVNSAIDLQQRIQAKRDDIVIIDWQLVQSETPNLVTALVALNPQLRVVVLLPQNYRQYRQLVWDAGACTGIPKEHVDQEWLSSILCVMHRAMEREAKLKEMYA